jgi:hypothetical protein
VKREYREKGISFRSEQTKKENPFCLFAAKWFPSFDRFGKKALKKALRR